jgi:hypothetical protein
VVTPAGRSLRRVDARDKPGHDGEGFIGVRRHKGLHRRGLRGMWEFHHGAERDGFEMRHLWVGRRGYWSGDEARSPFDPPIEKTGQVLSLSEIGGKSSAKGGSCDREAKDKDKKHRN